LFVGAKVILLYESTKLFKLINVKGSIFFWQEYKGGEVPSVPVNNLTEIITSPAIPSSSSALSGQDRSLVRFYI
jgi:hypothetical protein